MNTGRDWSAVAKGSWRRPARFSPRSSGEHEAPLTPSFQTTGLQNCQRMNFCRLKPPTLCSAFIC